MSADAFFRMGSSHSVCQDYALAGTWFTRPYAIVSDGCSGITDPKDPATPYTDWGARLLAWQARERLSPMSEGFFPQDALVTALRREVGHLMLPRSAIDATLLAVTVGGSGDFLVYQVGDGVIAWREVSGAIGYETVQFAKGMPRYLSYLLDSKAHGRLVAPSGDADDLLAGSYEVTSNRWDPKEGWGPQLLRTVFFEESTPYARQLRFHRELPRDGSLHAPVSVVALLSDGVESFTDRDGADVELETLLPELLGFKNLHGRFVTRRCTKFLEKVCEKNGWKHTDDFSLAAVAVAAEEEGFGLRASGFGEESGGERP